MRKKILAMVVISAFALGACQEDATMDELIEDIELNQTTDPNDQEDPPPSGNN